MSSGPVIHTADLPTALQNWRLPAVAVSGSNQIVPIAELERQAILNTLVQTKGDKLLAARLLGIGKTTLYRKLKEYGSKN
jgi:transcriptional regulator of acetoin/glycerol metabolism